MESDGKGTVKGGEKGQGKSSMGRAHEKTEDGENGGSLVLSHLPSLIPPMYETPISQRPCQYWVLIIETLTGMKWYLLLQWA